MYQRSILGIRPARFLSRYILVFLFLVDLFWVVLHVYNRMLPVPNKLLLLDTDHGYPELFQYVKECWIAIMLFFLASRKRAWLLVVWALLFVYLFLDDALMIHEGAGLVVANYLQVNDTLGLRARDIGELIFAATIAAIFIIPIGLLYVRCSKNVKQMSIILCILIIILAVFGVLVDAFHIVVKDIFNGFTMIEDGGEMFVMSVIVSYVATFFKNLDFAR